MNQLLNGAHSNPRGPGRRLVFTAIVVLASLGTPRPAAEARLDVGAPRCAQVSFGAPRLLAAGVGPALNVIAADFDENQRPDLLVQTPSGVFFISGLGAGAFAAPHTVSAHRDGTAIAAGDLNRDGHMDAVVLRREPSGPGPSTVRVLLGDGTGGFVEGSEVVVGIRAISMAVGDFDRDSRLDVVVRGTRDGTSQGGRLILLRGDGQGSFEPAFPESAAPVAGETLAGQIDRSGNLGLVFAVPLVRCASISVLPGDGSGGFGPAILLPFLGRNLILADMNKDGLADIVSSCFLTIGSTLSVALANGDGTFHEGATVPLAFFGTDDGKTVADFDGDGNLDILASSTAGNLLFRGDGRGGLSEGLNLGPVMPGVAADFNADGAPDLVSTDSQGRLTIRLNSCGGTSGSYGTTLLIPFLMAAPGANGARFSPELTVANRGPSAVRLDASYTAAIGLGDVDSTTTLAGGEQRTSLRNGVTGMGIAAPTEGPWGGTLRLRFSGLSSPEEVFALARIRNQLGPSRSFGVSFPGVRPSETFTGPSVIGGLRETAEDRSNLALVNAGDRTAGDVVLRVTLISTDAANPGRVTLPDLTLRPGGFFQFNRVLATSSLRASSAFAWIERVGGNAPYYAWGVVTDNRTQDGCVIPPVATGVPSGTRSLTLPFVGESGTFSSELVVTNASTSRKIAHFEWVATAVTTPDHTVRFTLDLAPNEAFTAPSFVDWLRIRGTPGVGPRGPSYAGALFVTVDANIDGLLVGTRTSSVTPSGRFSSFTGAIPEFELASRLAWLFGLRQDPEARTNLALVNVAESESSAFRIEIFDGDTGLAVATWNDVLVPPRGWRQLSSVLAAAAPDTRNAYARVTRTSGSAPFLTYAFVNDGATPGIGTGDGTYVPMRVETTP